MELQRGHIVRSRAGHDRGDLYCVMQTEGDFLLLADGKRKRLTSPKRKREKHVEPVGGPLPEEDLPQSDRALRRILAQARDALSGTPNGQGGNYAWQKTI